VTSRSSRLQTAGTVLVAGYPVGAGFGPRTLHDYEFLWMLHGSARRTLHPATGPDPQADRSLVLTPGTLVLSRSGAVESYQWDQQRPSRHAYLHFAVTDRRGLPDEAAWPTTRTFGATPVLEGLCAYLLELAGQESQRARALSDQVLELLLDVFLTGPLAQPEHQLPPVVAAVVDHVGRTWASRGTRAVGVGELAAAARASTGHLYRVFRERHGCGPARALEVVRLSRAAVQLQRTNASIAEVASLTGFADPYHFSRRFRSVYGIPPGAFRRLPGARDALAPLREARLLPLAHALSGPVATEQP